MMFLPPSATTPFENSNGRRGRRRGATLGLCLALSACGGSGSSDDVPGDEQGGRGGTSSAGSAGTSAGGNAGTSTGGSGSGTPTPGVCNDVVVASPPSSAAHLLQCSETAYTTNPPSGGPHYAVWPAFQSYDFAVPAGFLVHALEHGAVVFWYNCPEGCADEVAEVEQFIAGLPEDPLCDGTPALRRAVLVPYPALASRWAASAWGFALSADCFDSAAFGAFYTDHYAQGPEQLCAPGQPYTTDPCAQ